MLYFFILVLVILSLPIVHFTFSRIIMVIRLRLCCQKAGYEIRFNGPFSAFRRINGSKNDLFIKTERCIYSIKLVGFILNRKCLCFCDPTHYSIKDYSFSLHASIAFTKQYTLKTKKYCDFRAYLPEDSKGCALKPCYLLAPNLRKGMKTSYIVGNQMREIISGDYMGEAYFFSLRGVLREINGN